MAKRSSRAPGRVFISYRRKNTSHLAGRLYDRLADHFGDTHVFMDVDTIAPGTDFAEITTRAVRTCHVLLALIDHQWLTVTDDKGYRRLDDADDIVRMEIHTALKRDIIVIPVLIDGVSMPRQDDLPADLAALARRQAIQVRHDSFRQDAGRLVGVIEQALTTEVAGSASATERVDASDGAQPSDREHSASGPPIIGDKHPEVASTRASERSRNRRREVGFGFGLVRGVLFGAALTVPLVGVVAGWILGRRFGWRFGWRFGLGVGLGVGLNVWLGDGLGVGLGATGLGVVATALGAGLGARSTKRSM